MKYFLDVFEGYLNEYVVRESIVQKVSSHIAFGERISRKEIGMDDEYIVLLDDSHFSYVKIDVTHTCSSPYTYSDYSLLLKKKAQEYAVEHGVSPKQIRFLLHSLSVNGVETNYILGKIGRISFSLCMYILDYEYSYLWNNDSLPDVKRYPRHSHLIYDTDINKLQPLLIVNIDSFVTTSLVYENGRISSTNTLNYGVDMLYRSFEQFGVKEVLQNKEILKENELAGKLTKDACIAFVRILFSWLDEIGLDGKNVLLISSAVESPLFLENFSEFFTQCGGRAVLPYSGSKNKKYFGRTRSPPEAGVMYTLKTMF